MYTIYIYNDIAKSDLVAVLIATNLLTYTYIIYV